MPIFAKGLWYGPRRDRCFEGKCEGRIQGSGARSGKNRENSGYRDSPLLLLKIGTPPLLPVRLEVHPDWADDPLPVKTLEDGFVEPEAPEVRGVKDVLLPLVMGEAPGG